MACLQTAFSLKFPRTSCPVSASKVSLCLGAFRYRTLEFSDRVQLQKALVLVRIAEVSAVGEEFDFTNVNIWAVTGYTALENSSVPFRIYLRFLMT